MFIHPFTLSFQIALLVSCGAISNLKTRVPDKLAVVMDPVTTGNGFAMKFPIDWSKSPEVAESTTDLLWGRSDRTRSIFVGLSLVKVVVLVVVVSPKTVVDILVISSPSS
jgi:hypothetical protein